MLNLIRLADLKKWVSCMQEWSSLMAAHGRKYIQLSSKEGERTVTIVRQKACFGIKRGIRYDVISW